MDTIVLLIIGFVFLVFLILAIILIIYFVRRNNTNNTGGTNNGVNDGNTGAGGCTQIQLKTATGGPYTNSLTNNNVGVYTFTYTDSTYQTKPPDFYEFYLSSDNFNTIYNAGLKPSVGSYGDGITAITCSTNGDCTVTIAGDQFNEPVPSPPFNQYFARISSSTCSGATSNTVQVTSV